MEIPIHLLIRPHFSFLLTQVHSQTACIRETKSRLASVFLCVKPTKAPHKAQNERTLTPQELPLFTGTEFLHPLYFFWPLINKFSHLEA